MNIGTVQTWFTSFNPYSSSAGPQGAAAQAVQPSAYGIDQSFYNINRPATPDGAISKALVGGLTGYKFSKAPGPLNSQFLLSSAGVGAAITGTVSIIKNVASMSHNKQSASTTVANVLTDTLQGSVSGIGGGLGAWGTNKILTAMGAAAGTPMIIATVVGGAIGAIGLNQILNTEKLRREL